MKTRSLILLCFAVGGCQSADELSPSPLIDTCSHEHALIPHEHEPAHVHEPAPDEPASPVWNIPIVVSPDETIYAFGVQDHDIRTRSLTLRLISMRPDVTPGVYVRVRSTTHLVDIAGQTTTVDPSVAAELPYVPEPAAHAIQVYYDDIPPVHRAAVLSGWVHTNRGRYFYPALMGSGWGSIAPDEPWVTR